ncbi:uncharacterized protein F5147DRAFT_773175 [Suillus discolor]|uniref:Uncharacterized protein n=1 Tax=Suillus discolor TaxID=1912936 RepID=A0A9P7F8Z0_9AGAM|nr:uncharacterized protein F5147DRAFT_773175 [Suillus discolor]KAG2109363.1 hypothetical protein F5147DRAFT_773175 [Suillus discolor]
MSLAEASAPHDKDWRQDGGNPSDTEDQDGGNLRQSEAANHVETLEVGWAAKEKQINYYMAQGRALRRVVALFDNVEDLVAENDRRYDDEQQDQDATLEQDQLQVGYVVLMQTLPWFHKKGCELEYDDYLHMIKMLRQGADSARGNDTSKLKTLVSEWLNRDFKPDPPVDPEDKHSRGFTHNVCSMLLCPAELDWNDPVVRAGIRDRSEGYVVTDLSFPTFLYDKYAANPHDLEEGLFKGKILLQGYKAVFTSPSSARDVEGDGDGTDVIRNNTRAKKSSSGVKVKKHVAEIIKMKKVTPHSIAYIACQVRFTISSITSWRSVDGDFDYVQFWQTIMDFFERPPGHKAHCRVDRLLQWWTRKVFGRNHRNELSDMARASMSVNALARQRAQCDDAAFDSP